MSMVEPNTAAPEKVLAPAIVCAPVVTYPESVALAGGIEIVVPLLTNGAVNVP